MSGIDYSKWDNLDEYSDDDDDNISNEGNSAGIGGSSLSKTPRVTRLDEPCKVTFGGNSSSTTPIINIQPTTVTTATTTQSIRTDTCENPHNDERTGMNKERNNSSSSTTTSCQQPSSWTERGGLIVSESTTTTIDGKLTKKRMLYWSQDRYSVTLRLELHEQSNDEEEKIQLVDVDGILPFCDRFCATGSTRPVLRCLGITTTTENKILYANNTGNNPLVLLEGELPHPVHLAEEDDTVDWSIVRDNSYCRFLIITLYKAVPMQGLSVWWRRPMMKFPELDLEQVKDQPTTNHIGTSGTSSQDFLKSWEEAHKIFREEKKKKTLI